MQQDEFPLDGEGVGAARGAAQQALRIVPVGAVKLSAAQKKFNALVKRIEALRAGIARDQRAMDAALAEYTRRIHPWTTKEREARRGLLRALMAWWRKPKGLGVRQRSTLRDLMLEQFNGLAGEAPGPGDADLVALVAELEADLAREQRERLKREGVEGFDDEEAFGDEDGSEDWADEEAPGGAASHEKEPAGAGPFGGGERGFFGAGGSGGTRPESQAEARRRAQDEARAEARKRGIGTIYKQLAKVLHPDLERDPTRRAEKQVLMQQVIAAHRAGDLHTLLRLEMEHIHREEAQWAEMSEEKLAIYRELLEEQVRDLERERHDMVGEARYDVIRGYWDPFTQSFPDWDEVAAERRRTVELVQETSAALAGPPAEAKVELREALKAFAAAQKRRARAMWGYF